MQVVKLMKGQSCLLAIFSSFLFILFSRDSWEKYRVNSFESIELAFKKERISGPFTRGPLSSSKLCTEFSPWSRGWGPDCDESHDIKKGWLPMRSGSRHYHHKLALDARLTPNRPKIRTLTSLTDNGSHSSVVVSDKKWGAWRTPGNSNAYVGMKTPARNDNPFGNNVLFRNSDKEVNVKELESKWYNPLFDSWDKGLPRVFYEDDIAVPCEEELVDCSPIKTSFPVSQIHTPYLAFADWNPEKRNSSEENVILPSTADNTRNGSSVVASESDDHSNNRPSGPWSIDVSWPDFGLNLSWPQISVKPTYPKDSFPIRKRDSSNQEIPEESKPLQPHEGYSSNQEIPEESNPWQPPFYTASGAPYDDDVFVPAQPIVARRAPHFVDRKMDPIDKLMNSNSLSGNGGEHSSIGPSQVFTQGLRSEAETSPKGQRGSTSREVNLQHSKNNDGGNLEHRLSTAALGLAALGGHVARLGRQLPAWGKALTRDVSSVETALREPPQRLVQAALDQWIEASVH